METKITLITFNCFNHYCKLSPTCEWYICPTGGKDINEENCPKDLSCYKKLETVYRSK
jgi:hypothetical protein